jgi:excisionase family DNA binding protein
MGEPFLSVKQVAELLAIRRHGVLALIHSGELPAASIALKANGRPRWRISPDDIERFIAKRRGQTAPPRRRRRKPAALKKYF